MLCHFCSNELENNVIALNKKLLGNETKKNVCLDCLADHLGCTIEDLLIKIEEFKGQGCNMFK